ncbi:MAG: hypothetical protein IT366_17235 [Candidatus Hydrogenedentes bacterium]|nr:hypothetical protein [Candidatus Hydrogenedentota bacterium]
MRTYRALFVLGFIVLSFGVAAGTLDFKLAKTESQNSTSSYNSFVEKSGDLHVLPGKRVFLHVEDREGLGGVLAWEVRNALQREFGVTVTLLNNAPGPDDFPLVLVAVRDESGFWSPFYARKSVTVLGKFTSYTSHIMVDWSEEVSIDQTQAQGELPLYAQMKCETSATSMGFISLPAFRNELVRGAAEAFAKYLKDSFQNAEQKVREKAQL